MASEHILRIARSDSEGDYVLVNVTSNGPQPLDVKLAGTEGDNPYITTLKQSKIARLQGTHSNLTSAAWETILVATLLQQRLSDQSIEALQNLEVIATVTDDQLNLIFRKNIKGIHQRLGEITLAKNEDEQIDITSWALTSAHHAESLEAEVLDLQSKFAEQGDVVKKLTQQLEDLVEEKAKHDLSLLEKFRDLLNEKKLKIRDQQRLLATAKVDPTTAEQIHATRSNQPSSSRNRKRKAGDAPPPASDSEDSGFEKLVPDAAEAATPERSDDSSTNDEDDEDPDVALPAQVGKAKTLAGKGGRKATGKDRAVKAKVKEKEKDKEVAKSPPPRRELPFTRGRGAVKARVMEAEEMEVEVGAEEKGAGEDEAETSDDEL